MFQDAPSYSLSPSYSSPGSDDDHAVFCFCGNEVDRDEDGEVGIYCSVSCARQDALSSLSGPSSATHSRPPSTLQPPTFPTSLSNATLRPAIDQLSLHSSESSKTLGPSLFAEALPTSATSSILSNSAGPSTPMEEGDEVDWQGSHYRRMERERLVALEKRRADREARKLASENAKKLEELRAQYQEHAQQQQLVQQAYQQHRPQQSSSSSIESYYAGGAGESSLSRSTTSSSTTSSTSGSNRFVSTHPSRSRTPDLLPSGSGGVVGQHGRNESLASTISTRSSASGTSGWGWNSRLGWGAGADASAPVIAEEEETEEEEEAVERIRVPLRTGGKGKGKQREEWGASGEGKGMRMSDVLNEILEMEKGFVVGGLGSPPGRESWMGTPPRMTASQQRESSTPTGRKLGLGLPSSVAERQPRTPSRTRTPSKGTKRSHAQIPPPSPPSNSHYHPHPQSRAVSSRRTGSLGTSHRRSVSSPSSLSLLKKHHRPAKSLPFAVDEDVEPSSRRQRRSGSPVPPPSSVIQSRPRTLVYSPGGFGGSQRSLSVSSIANDEPLRPPQRRVPTSPSNSFKGDGAAGFAFPPLSSTSRHPTSASLVVLLDTSPPLPPPTFPHSHTSSTFPRSDSYTSSLTTSIYEPTSPTLTPTGSFFHPHPHPNPNPNPRDSTLSLEAPAAPALAPPLFPCSPTPGTPEMVRMPERSRARLRALLLSEGEGMDWRDGATEPEGVDGKGWGDVEFEMEVDSSPAPVAPAKGKLGWVAEGWMPTFLEAEGFVGEQQQQRR